MKKIVAIFMMVILVMSSASAFAGNDITVTVEGVALEFDVPPQIIEGRTLVPVRKIFEALGARVDWVQDAQLVIASYGTSILSMEIGNETFTVTDVLTGETRVIALDVPSQIVDGSTLVPARAISESMGKKVNWINETRTVTID